MDDLLGSLTKLHTVILWWLNGDNIGWKVTRGAQWRALNLVLRGVLQVVSEPVPSRKCADEDIRPLRGVDCDNLSGRVRGTGSYLVSNPTSPGWWRKGLKGKRLPFIITEAFSEHLAKGFVGTPKLSVLQWEQFQDG